jgi:hypothetical protein
MKYSLEAGVTGNLFIGSQLRTINGDKEYILTPDLQGRLVSIKIIAIVNNPAKFSSQIIAGEGSVAPSIIMEGDRELHSELIQELQELESDLLLGTNGSLTHINWDTAKEGYIPETDQERKQNPVISFTFSKKYTESTCQMDQESFEKTIQNKDHYKSLVTPKAFFREGINAFDSRSYINAFYNFYFILEDLYGQGKTKNKDVSKVMIASSEFRKSLEWVLANFIDNRHETNLRQFCLEEKTVFDTNGLIELLTRVRGNLHHYSSSSSKHVGTPFNNEDFESIAFFSMGLAIRSIWQKTAEIESAES